MIGEIGGNAEVEAARWAKDNCKKPIARLHRRSHGTSRTPHGPRGCDHRRSR